MTAIIFASCFTHSSVSAKPLSAVGEKRAQELGCLAQSNLAKRDYDAALKLADQAILCEPHWARLYSLRGAIFAKKNLFDRAAHDFCQATALSPTDEDIIVSQGLNYYEVLNDFERANHSYTKALTISPNNVRALALRGESFFRLGKITQAFDDLNLAIKIAPQEARLWNSRGWIYSRLLRFREALSDYKRASEIEPSLANYLFYKADTYRCLGQPAEGLRDIDLAIRMSHDEADFYSCRGRLLAQLHNYADCIKAYDTAEKLGATDIFDERAEAQMHAGNYRGALSDWTVEVERYPTESFFCISGPNATQSCNFGTTLGANSIVPCGIQMSFHTITDLRQKFLITLDTTMRLRKNLLML